MRFLREVCSPRGMQKKILGRVLTKQGEHVGFEYLRNALKK